MESFVNYRFERKYVIPSSYRYEISKLLKSNNLFFYKKYPDRKIRSLYFDDYNFSSFNENVNGLSERKKYRVRWYGDTFENVTNGRLELKIKKNRTNTKRFWQLNPFQFNEKDNSKKIYRKIYDSLLSKDGKIILNNLKPIVFTEYDRKYLETKCSSIRATIDNNLSFRKTSNILSSSRIHDFMILELKYSTNQEEIYNELAKNLPLRSCRMSKYVNAVSMLSLI